MSDRAEAGRTEAQGSAPSGSCPIVTFHHPSGDAVTWGELDPEFLRASGIGPSSWDRPVRVELVAQRSKRGNTFFSYEQGRLPLPDGLETEIRLDGVALEADEVGESKRGNPTRRHHGTLTIDGTPYDAVGYVAKSRSPYWVKVHVQKAVGRRGSVAEPRGGRFV